VRRTTTTNTAITSDAGKSNTTAIGRSSQCFQRKYSVGVGDFLAIGAVKSASCNRPSRFLVFVEDGIRGSPN
jgi:hypothetical protein